MKSPAHPIPFPPSLALLPLLAMVILIAGANPASAQPKSTLRDSVKNRVANYKLHGRLPLDQLVQFTTGADGQIVATVDPSLPTQNEPLRIEVEGSDATWIVQKRVLGGGAVPNNSYISLTRYDFDAPDDQPWSTGVTLRSNYLLINAVVGDQQTAVRVSLVQSSGTLILRVTNNQPRPAAAAAPAVAAPAQAIVLTVQATSLNQLRAEHPEEVRTYLAPALRALAGRSLFRPGPADVYRAFDQIPANPAVARKLDALLAGLESDEFAKRDKATANLTNLGPPGVLAALRRDNSDLSPEAQNRLQQFIAAHATLSLAPGEAAKTRADRSFLIDCLDDNDPAVRAAAKASLEKLLHRPLPYDTTLDGKARESAVEALRKTINTTTRPKPAATRPM